jgi:cytochrome P450
MMTQPVVKPKLSGPKGQFIVGNAQQFNRDSLNFLLAIREHGDIAVGKFGPFPMYFFNHPDYLREILVTQASKVSKDRITKQVLSPTLGNGIFLSDGDFWKKQRALMQPVFHAKRIFDYGETITRYTEELITEWQNGATRAVDADMTAVTMRIIAKVLFDCDIHGEESGFSKDIKEILHIMERRFKTALFNFDWMPTPQNRHMAEVVKRLDTIIQRFIDERRKTGEDKGDLLALLLSAHDENNEFMSDKQVRDEAMTLFGAGHETTAVTMAWVWYVLSQHHDVQAKLHEELDRVLGGRTPNVNDLPNLPYTEMVIKETMRLYPAVFATTRIPKEEITIGGHTFKPPESLILNIWGVHRDARFFPEPDKFDPERFSAEREKDIVKYSYLPFGAGPRVCIGNAFAMMEARLILATVAQRFTLDVAEGLTVEPDRQFTVKPKYGLSMVVRERERAMA